MKKTHAFFTFVTLCTGIIGFAGANTPGQTTTTQTAVSVPSMLDTNDEYTYIVKKIDAEMDMIMAECPALGLKKPELLTGEQQQQPQPTSNDPTTDTSDNGNSPESPITNNDDEIVFQL